MTTLTAPAPTSVRTVRTLDDLHGLESPWRDLQAANPRATVFSSWQWNLAAARHFCDASALNVIAIKDRGTTVALAPLAWRRVVGMQTLAFLGACGCDYARADYQDILMAPDSGVLPIEVMVNALAAEPRWQLLWLQELPAASPLLAALPTLARQRGWHVLVEDASDVYPVELPATWDAYAERLSPNTRSNLGRKTRRLEREHDTRFRRVEDAAALPAALETLFALHERRWRGDGGRAFLRKPTIFPDQRTRAFHRELAASLLAEGALDLTLLAAGDETIGARYSFVFNGTKSFYASGYATEGEWAKHSLGLVMDGHSLHDSIDRGLAREDFLRNDGAYKQHYDPTRSDNRQVIVFRSEAARRRFLAYRGARSLARRLLERWR